MAFISEMRQSPMKSQFNTSAYTILVILSATTPSFGTMLPLVLAVVVGADIY